jgi:hypothetical protein
MQMRLWGTDVATQSVKNATDCNELISKGLRQRMLAQDSFSSRLTM